MLLEPSSSLSKQSGSEKELCASHVSSALLVIRIKVLHVHAGIDCRSEEEFEVGVALVHDAGSGLTISFDSCI
jgi:hypothetical protein